QGWLSVVFNGVCSYLSHKYHGMMFWDHNTLIPELLTKYCKVIRSNREPSGCI
ncbi:hypothetical protein L873DRAFT_1719976, partial [Choiromyces venosus 120613-1]